MGEKTHAILSAAGSKRWLTCTPSAILEQEFEEEKSIFAEEGTLAHDISELYLSLYLGIITKEDFNIQLKKLCESEYYCSEMDEYIKGYVDFCIERINNAKSKGEDDVILLEQKLDFSKWVPEGFGTGDLVVISDNALEIVDLKYDKGVAVSAKENTQMMIYALGAIYQFECLYDIEKVTMTILQPRLDSISTYDLTISELLNWAEEYVKPRANMAIKGEGKFCAGEHCRFCRARYVCRARATENLKVLKHDFKLPNLLTDDEVCEILITVDHIQKWCSDVYDYALNQAETSSKKWSGFKLVEGRSNRKYKDEGKIIDTLKKAEFEKDKISKSSLLSITALEKVVGKKKFNELLGELIIKPIGKPTLVLEIDKRPEINAINNAKVDFKN
ncbi:DUF2800 domain-containing protein [Clostridium tarantellae]|uniref:DUF2800 domain-containing protein n=1 Tax=Clostridium tarantellae TaxID=39493 RepID=A0A6I1MM67_9CLOT|nr:DUF2800 domain-containing protein [Clostridium tarantellae]MPQ44596.1 DUF2800 domain-containing protein [Clostridium tarantellae]